MKYPREEKLPKWAQELLYQERLKTALRFPDQPCPEPDFRGDYDAGASFPDGLKVVYSADEFAIRKHYVKGSFLYRTPEREGFGSQARGSYFQSFEDARLARRHLLARKYARSLLEAETCGVLS